MIAAAWSFITGHLEWVASVFALAIAALFGRERAKRKQAEDYIETRRRIDEVDSDPIDADVAEWLRQRGKSKRDM